MSLQETLDIERLVYGGDGLARLNGKVVLVPFVLPNEIVHADIERAKNDLWRGKLTEVVTPASARVQAACPYFTRCGGCQYQHARYTYQLDTKSAILREVLRRVGKITYDGGIETIAGDPWQYRNRVQLHAENGAVGYFEQGSHNLCAVDHCPVSSPALNMAIEKLNKTLTACRWFKGTVELFTNETEVQVNVLDRMPAPVKPIFDAIGSTSPLAYNGFQVSRNSFFQVNRFLIDPLVKCATGGYSGKTALDLYAGVGLFASVLAETFEQVTAVESGRSAFRDLRTNMQHRNAPVATDSRTAEDFLAAVHETPDFILTDPPRAGLGKQVVNDLLRIRSPHLTIVSCDPATLARDLQALLGGGYKIAKVTMVDLFPQTSHIETVVSLYL